MAKKRLVTLTCYEGAKQCMVLAGEMDQATIAGWVEQYDLVVVEREGRSPVRKRRRKKRPVHQYPEVAVDASPALHDRGAYDYWSAVRSKGKREF